MIVAAESCDIEGGIVCTPSNVNELFVFKINIVNTFIKNLILK